jgi:hypothetical protein
MNADSDPISHLSSHIIPDEKDSQNQLKHRKGCTCKKSGCVKGYCECFSLGVPCNEACKCKGCKNCEKKENGDEKAVMELKKKDDLNSRFHANRIPSSNINRPIEATPIKSQMMDALKINHNTHISPNMSSSLFSMVSPNHLPPGNSHTKVTHFSDALNHLQPNSNKDSNKDSDSGRDSGFQQSARKFHSNMSNFMMRRNAMRTNHSSAMKVIHNDSSTTNSNA